MLRLLVPVLREKAKSNTARDSTQDDAAEVLI
jgi:hypothetical protein